MNGSYSFIQRYLHILIRFSNDLEQKIFKGGIEVQSTRVDYYSIIIIATVVETLRLHRSLNPIESGQLLCLNWQIRFISKHREIFYRICGSTIQLLKRQS